MDFQVRTMNLKDNLRRVKGLIDEEGNLMLRKSLNDIRKDVCGELAIGAFLDEKSLIPIGYISLHLDSFGNFEVGSLVVDRDYRGKGIGRRLVQEVTVFAKKLFPDAVIFCLSKNPVAISIFEKEGYKIYGQDDFMEALRGADPWQECRISFCPCWKDGRFQGCEMTAMVLQDY